MQSTTESGTSFTALPVYLARDSIPNQDLDVQTVATHRTILLFIRSLFTAGD